MKDIYIHHSGSIGSDKYSSSAHLTPAQINQAHKERWNFKSSLGYFGGYNVIYDPKTREFTQHRAIGEETAAQRGYNNEFSLCIIGNYSRTPIGAPKSSVDELKPQTRTDVSEFLFDLINGNIRQLRVHSGTTPNFSIQRVFPHRKVGSTECYGSFLDDTVFKADLINLYTEKIGLLKKLLELYLVVLGLFQKRNQGLASSERECDATI